MPTAWNKFPMRGNFHGPGGSLVLVVLVFLRSCNNLNKKKKRKMREAIIENWDWNASICGVKTEILVVLHHGGGVVL